MKNHKYNKNEQLGIKVTTKTISRICSYGIRKLCLLLINKNLIYQLIVRPQAIGALAKRYDWILIDDDPLVHMAWQFISKNMKTFLGFKSYKEFSDSKDNIDPTSNFISIPIFGDGIKGEVIYQNKCIRRLQNLFIATGYDPDHFKNLDYITDVIGKSLRCLRVNFK